jgi:acetoacetate decarboxylase
MKLDPGKVYVMPLGIGAQFDVSKSPAYSYKQVENLVLRYQTDPDAIQDLVPVPFQLGKDPTVTLAFSFNDGVDFMAGRGYRIATLMVEARFDGEKDHVEGNFVVIMFEDDALPILMGRETLGVPKIYADISPIITNPGDGHLRCEVSRWGHLLFGIKVHTLVEQNAVVRGIANRTKLPPYLCYKHIPSLDGPPDASYPTLWFMDSHIDQLWMGKEGEIYLGNPGEEEVSYYAWMKKIVESLPVLRVTQVLRTRGSGLLRSDLFRRLE